MKRTMEIALARLSTKCALRALNSDTPRKRALWYAAFIAVNFDLQIKQWLESAYTHKRAGRAP